MLRLTYRHCQYELLLFSLMGPIYLLNPFFGQSNRPFTPPPPLPPFSRAHELAGHAPFSFDVDPIYFLIR